MKQRTKAMKNNLLTKLLAVAGVILIGIPVIAPLVFAIISLTSGNGFRLDYMMPAELFIMVLIGAGLLIWASIRAKELIKPIAWTLGISVVLLIACQVIAQISGLADGRIEASGPYFIIVMSMLILFDLGVVALTVLGGMLISRVFSAKK
jgi:hypothetical protein